MEAGGVLEAWKVRWKQCDCALFWSGDSAKPKSSLLISWLIRQGPWFQNQGAKKGGAQGRKLVYNPYKNHMELICITANKMESIRITIYKLDFFDNITKVGRIVIYEFTTPFTGRWRFKQMKWIVLLFYALVVTFNTQTMVNEYGRRNLET
jgi:hypothetical protein